MRPASRLHETSFPSLSYLRAQMHGLLSHRTRPTRYPFRQVINVPLLRKRIHLRIHLVSSPEVPLGVAYCSRPAVCKSPDLASDRATRRSHPSNFLGRPSIERIWWSIDTYRRGSFPEVIKYPTKSLCVAGWLKAIPKAPSGQA